MKLFSKLASIAFSLLAVLSVAQAQQNTMTPTTLSAAIDNKTQIVTVASATGITAPSLPTSQGGIGSSSSSTLTVLVVDKEAMSVVSVNSTTVTVRRGQFGTQQRAHASGARVWAGAASWFPDLVSSTFSEVSGSCTRTNLLVVPVVYAKTGNVFDCMNGQWGSFTTGPLRVDTVASAAGVIKIYAPITHITGALAITGITPPPALPPNGCVQLIPDGAFTTTNATNIAIASTGVVSKVMTMCYDSGTSKWYPSY